MHQPVETDDENAAYDPERTVVRTDDVTAMRLLDLAEDWLAEAAE